MPIQKPIHNGSKKEYWINNNIINSLELSLVEITRGSKIYFTFQIFAWDSAVVQKAVFPLPSLTQPPLYKFLGVIYVFVFLPACMSVCLSAQCGGVNRQVLYCKAIYVLIYILFFWLLPLAFLLHLLCFAFCVLNFVFRKFFYIIFFCLLRFNFQLFTFVVCV